MKSDKPKINPQDVEVIESVIAKGDRVEIIPTKDGYKIVKVIRREVKDKHNV